MSRLWSPLRKKPQATRKSSITVRASKDAEIPGRSVRVVVATLKEEFCIPTELDGMIEPAVKLPKHLCVARSLGHVSSDGSIMVQVMNVSPCAVKVYRGVQSEIIYKFIYYLWLSWVCLCHKMIYFY